MKKFLKIYVLLILSSAVLFAKEASDIGNLREYIDTQLEKGNKNINIPKGKYEVDLKGRAHIVLQNLDGVSINFNDSDLICLQTAIAFYINNCKNLRIENLNVDYHPLPFTQGRIVGMSDDKQVHEIEIFDGYPDTSKLDTKKYEIFDKDTRKLKTYTYYISKFEIISPTRFKAYKGKIKPNRPFQNEEIGDIVVAISHSQKAHGGHAFNMQNNENLYFKNINLYASPYFGFLEFGSSGSVYENCRVLRREIGDIAKRANPRVRSLNADAFHAKNSFGGPTYLNCESGYNGDDSIAINGPYHLVMENVGKNMRVIASNDKLNIKKGDKIEVFKTDGSVQYAFVESVEKGKDMTEEELKWFSTLWVYPSAYKSKIFHKGYNLVLDTVVNAPKRSMVLNPQTTGQGFKIIGGSFGNNRSRGLVIKSGNGIIDGATITGSWMESIKISPEWYWFEGGHSDNLIIKNCNIVSGVGPAISVRSTLPKEKDGFSPAGVNDNIQILNNNITYSDLPAIFVTSVSDLKIQGNKLKLVDEKFYNCDNFGRHSCVNCKEPITIINCTTAK